MKKNLIFIPLISLIALPTHAQNLIMTDEELARVVCNHLATNSETKVAVAKAYSETKNLLEDWQKETLKKLANGKLDTQQYCAAVQN